MTHCATPQGELNPHAPAHGGVSHTQVSFTNQASLLEAFSMPDCTTFLVGPIHHSFPIICRSCAQPSAGASKPSITLQPFYMLHLDIQQPGVRSIEDALDVLTGSEHLSGERGKSSDLGGDWRPDAQAMLLVWPLSWAAFGPHFGASSNVGHAVYVG